MSARVFKDTDFLDAVPSTRTFSEDDFADTPAPRYFTNPADQAIAETPVVRQVFRGAANTLDTVKSMALRGKAVFNSAIDDRGGAYDALKQADAIDAEKARREAEFQKTSGTAGNIGAGVVESLTLAAPAAMMGGAPAAIGAASASQGNQAYYEGKKAGLTGTNLAQHVAMQTLLEGAPAAMSQVAGVGGLEKRLAALGEPVQRGVKAALARFGKTSLDELPEELVTTLTQQIAGAKAGTGTATPQDLANGAFQTTLQTLATAGLVESPSIARGAVDAMRRPPAPPSSDTPANAAPTGDMNLTLTPEQPVTQSDVADIFAMFDEPAAQPAAGAPTPPVARRTPDTLPPLPPGATIPVQGTTAPRAQQPAVAPIAPGSAVMRPVPTLTPEEVQAWSEEADALAPGEQEIVADYLMQNPGNPERLSPREIVARGKRDVWRMTPEEQAQYEQAMGLNEQQAETTAPAQPQETTNEEVQRQGRQEEVAPPAPTPRGRKTKQAPVTPVDAEQQASPVASSTGPTPASPEGAGVSKQPWEMTRDEYHVYNAESIISDYEGGGSESRGYAAYEKVKPLSEAEKADIRGDREFSDRNRRGTVEAALRDGKPVPTSVLADYPDLAPPTPPAPISPAVEPAKRPAPPRKGSTSPTGWKGRTATVDGRQLEVAKDKDGTWNALIDGDVVSLGHKTATDAREAAEQDMRDQRNASEEEALAGVNAPATPDSSIVPFEQAKQWDVYKVKVGGKDRYAVRSNMDSPRGGGDTLHDSPAEAAAEAVKEQARVEANAAYKAKTEEANKAKAEADAAAKAKKNDLGGFTDSMTPIQRGKVATVLDAKINRDNKIWTRREWIEDSVSTGRRAPKSEEVPDEAARKRAGDAADRMQRSGVPTGNQNHPETIKYNALREQEKSATKTEYRMERPDGAYMPVSKTEFDYAKHLSDKLFPRGPAPADTGIYRDLTAAAREGKRFVAELHERIAPALERIYAQSKSAVDFVKQAVAKIGKHIRPYAKRFAAEVKRGVRATNAEFRQNPTRGSGPLPSRKQPKAQRESNKAFSAGFNRGQHFGGMRTREEITAFLERASAVLPKEQFAARLKIAKKLLSTDLQSDQKRQDRFNRFIEATRTQVYKAKTISDIAKQSGKLQSAMKKMEPNLKSVVKEVLATFSETKPTDATIQKAEALLMAVADGKTIAHPKAVAAAEKAIDTFLNDKSLASMPLDRLRRLKDTLENMNALHEGNMEQLKEARRELKRQYEQAAKDISDNTETPFEGDEAARKGLIRWVMRDVGMNINNKLLALAPEGSTLHEIAIRMTDAGENRESAHRIEARDYIMGRLAKLKGSDGKPLVVRHPSDDSYTLHPEFEAMSLMLSDYANKTPLGKAIARKRGKAPELIGTQLPSGKNIYLTSAERVRLYQLGLDPNARYQITREGSEGIYLPRKASDKIQKLTPADLTAIEASLTDNEKAIAQAMFEFDNGRAKEAVNEMSRKEFGRDLFAEDDKTSYRRYQHDKEVGSMTEHVGKTFIENQGMLKDITGGTSPIVLGDALSEYFAHQARVAAIVGRMTPSMRLRELASTESFREAVRKSSAQGENALRDIERHFEKYGQISGEQDTAMWAVNGILSRLASAWLGFNPKTIITTPLSAWSMQSRIPTRYLIKNASPRTRDSKVLAEIRKHAPKMYEMMTSSGFSVVSPETTGESAQKFFGKGARGHERAQFFLHEANNIPAIMAWKSSKDWGESQGLTGDALIKFTAEKAQDAYSVSQPDNRWKYTSGAKLDARSSAFWRVATFLQGQTSKQYNQAVEAALAYRYSDRSAAAKAKAVKDMAVPLLGQAILYNAVGYAVMGAKDEWDKMRGEKASRLKNKTAKDFAFDTLRSATENIMIAGPIVSDAADVARRGLRGESPPRVVSGSESALARPLTLAFKLIYQSARAWDKPSKERLTAMRKSIVEAASLMGFDTSIINEALDMAAER